MDINNNNWNEFIYLFWTAQVLLIKIFFK